MFKKIEIWILYLVILFGIMFAVLFGVLVRQELVGSVKAGWLSKMALELAEIPANLKTILKGLNSDLAVDDRFPNLKGFDGKPNNQESYLLLSRYDGDLAEGIVELVNLTNFEVLHSWNPDLDKFNALVEKVDEYKYLDRDRRNSRHILIHPKLTEDNGLLFGQFIPFTKINSCSELVHQNTHDLFHHSIESDIEGNIWFPSQMYPQSLPPKKVGRKLVSEGGFTDDAIVKLSPKGDILFEKSVSQIFIENGLEYLIFSIGGDGRNLDIDPIHLNDIQPVDFDSDFWKSGDVFLSLRNQSMVLLYRPSTNEIIWKGTGPFFAQHDVDILDDHRISVFNNNSKDYINGAEIENHSEVIIYNFRTNKYSLYQNESLAKHSVKTLSQGRSEILPNGDMFIEETDYGRTLYFNSDGSLRWTHVNRAENGRVYIVGWSRILYTKDDIQLVKGFLENKGSCNE